MLNGPLQSNLQDLPAMSRRTVEERVNGGVDGIKALAIEAIPFEGGQPREERGQVVRALASHSRW